MQRIFLLTAIFFFSAFILRAQEAAERESSESGESTYEIIVSGIYAYNLEEEKGLPGAELHFTYWFNRHWGAGATYIAKFEEEEVLSDIALLGSWNPSRLFTINAGPNFGFKAEKRDFEVSLYVEGELNIRPAEWFLFGPNLGFLAGNSSEIATGIHVGFEF